MDNQPVQNILIYALPVLFAVTLHEVAMDMSLGCAATIRRTYSGV